MKRLSFLLFPLLAFQFPAFSSDSPSQNPISPAAKQQAESRYASDKKLCAEESDSSARMQCLRDAKADYDKALAGAAKQPAAETKSKARAAACTDCGKVVSVTTSTKQGEGGALGILGGGVAGALLGSQVGSGRGKDLATIAGAAGGAYAGHKIEEKVKSSQVWSVRIRMDSGEDRTVDFAQDPGFASGDLVRVSGNTVTRR